MQADDATQLIDYGQLMKLVRLHELQYGLASQRPRYDQRLPMHDAFNMAAQIQTSQQSPPDVPVGDGSEQDPFRRHDECYLETGLVQIPNRFLQRGVGRN